MVEIVLSAAVILLLILSAPGLKRSGARGMVIIAMLSALASAGRAALASIPSVQPATFVIIVCGACLDGGAGFICGVVTALLSSLLTSVGPWTVWQALLWGLIGFFAGYLKNAKPWMLAVYGLVSGFVFGWIMNLWYYTAGIVPLTLGTYLAACAASLPFDAAHALTNFGLLLAFGGYSVRLLTRLAQKQNGGES